jgi:hypothetical protein
MSGFEVVGVVLGSLPLLISAVDTYMDLLRAGGMPPIELGSIHRQLATERAKLYNVCEQLLGAIVLQYNIEPILQDPTGPLWRTKKLNDKNRRALGDSYAPFETTVFEIKDAIDSITRRLQLERIHDGKASPSSPMFNYNQSLSHLAVDLC